MKTVCPTEEILADFLEGRLSNPDRSDIETHLSDCTRCLEEVMVTKRMIQHTDTAKIDSVPQRVTDAAVKHVTRVGLNRRDRFKEINFQFIKTIYSWICAQMSMIFYDRSRFSAIRSTAGTMSIDRFHVRKAFKEIATEIEIEKTGNSSAAIRVTLINDFKNAKNIRVTLLNNTSREISSYLLSGGFVVFNDIPFGRYRLEFMKNGEKIGTYPFETKESRHGRG